MSQGIGETGLGHLADLVDVMPVGVFLDHPIQGCIYANAALLKIFGLDWENFRGFGWARFVVPEDTERIQNAISAYQHDLGSLNITYRIQISQESPIRWVNADVRAVIDEHDDHVGSICVVRDVTEETERMQDVVEDQKMEALGQLAARLAHDLNNLLTAIIGNTELLASEIQSDKGRARLQNIELVFDQAKYLTSQLLTLSGKEVAQASALDLDQELQRLERLIQSTLGRGVELVLDLNGDDGHVALNFSQLGQIMLNLASNARDAMNGKGRLQLSTTREERAIRMTVQDNGSGMDAETLGQAFAPFFTTKGRGRGSGLGLTTVKNLVELVSGDISVNSAPGQGTSLCLALPLVEPLEPIARPESDSKPVHRSGVVLIVEDEDAIRQSLAYSLALVGYTVVTSASIAEARERITESDELSALVSDVLLPDGLGTELVAEISQKWPGLPIVFNSGYSGEASDQLSSLRGSNAAFVAKPYRAYEILEALDSLRPAKGGN